VSSTQPVLPASAIEEASRRISLIYQNIIFKNDDDEDESADYVAGAGAVTEGDAPANGDLVDQTTLITWAPTPGQDDSHRQAASTTADMSKSRLLRDSTSIFEETQDTGSCNYSDSSSIARFPQFHFNLHILNSIGSLVSMMGSAKAKGSRKVNVLVAVLEVDGPDLVPVKRGRDAGKEVSLLKMILGDDDGNVCKLTAWREVAELWGDGTRAQRAIRRGDVVLFQSLCSSINSAPFANQDIGCFFRGGLDILLCWEPPTSSTLNFTASPHLKSHAEICYRTMVYSPEDNKLRPDLRLGYSDASVRRVSSVVKWFQNMAGL
jgi:hypothetical protein